MISDGTTPLGVRSRGKPVLTLDPRHFAEASQELFAIASRACAPIDVVVGIATGGDRVVEAMDLPATVRVLSCRLQRPSTAAKSSSAIARLLAHLPRAAADRLRRFEDRRGERAELRPVEAPEYLRAQVREIAEAIGVDKPGRLLVVDDAVDSGATLACVLGELRAALPGVTIESAVLTTTRPADRRLCSPDFSLLDGVLCRFPWSLDYRPVP